MKRIKGLKTRSSGKGKAKKLISLHFARLVLATLFLTAILPGCASLKSFFALDPPKSRNTPISNPFGTYGLNGNTRENIILRTKKGDRSVEVELPGSTSEMSDFSIPLSPSFREGGRGASSGYTVGSSNYNGVEPPVDSTTDETYRNKAPSMTDREITRNFPQGMAEDEGKRTEIENGLGLMPSEEQEVRQDQSYLSVMDRVKQLYKMARYEAALLELDELVRAYPTDTKIYEMRGTLLDRLGKPDLAVRSWNQALRFDPSNTALRKYVERKQQGRGLASP